MFLSDDESNFKGLVCSISVCVCCKWWKWVRIRIHLFTSTIFFKRSQILYVCIFSINKNYNEMSFSAWSNFIVINREEYSFAYESNLYMKHIGIAVEQQQQRSHMPITTTFTFNDWVLSRHLSRACVLRAHRPFICCILFHFIFHCEIALRLSIFSVCGWVDTILGYYCFLLWTN